MTGINNISDKEILRIREEAKTGGFDPDRKEMVPDRVVIRRPIQVNTGRDFGPLGDVPRQTDETNV